MTEQRFKGVQSFHLKEKSFLCEFYQQPKGLHYGPGPEGFRFAITRALAVTLLVYEAGVDYDDALLSLCKKDRNCGVAVSSLLARLIWWPKSPNQPLLYDVICRFQSSGYELDGRRCLLSLWRMSGRHIPHRFFPKLSEVDKRSKPPVVCLSSRVGCGVCFVFVDPSGQLRCTQSTARLGRDYGFINCFLIGPLSQLVEAVVQFGLFRPLIPNVFRADLRKTTCHARTTTFD